MERCLKWNPTDRATAQQLLDDPWLKMEPKYDARMDPQHYREWMHSIDPEFESTDSEEGEGEGDDDSDEDGDNAEDGD